MLLRRIFTHVAAICLNRARIFPRAIVAAVCAWRRAQHTRGAVLRVFTACSAHDDVRESKRSGCAQRRRRSAYVERCAHGVFCLPLPFRVLIICRAAQARVRRSERHTMPLRQPLIATLMPRPQMLDPRVSPRPALVAQSARPSVRSAARLRARCDAAPYAAHALLSRYRGCSA